MKLPYQWVQPMLKLSNQAFTLIELMCSIALFSLMSITAASVITCSCKLKLYNENLRNYTYFVEGLKNNIAYNLKAEELCYIKENGKKFIHKENINIENLKGKNLKEILCANVPKQEPYIQIDVEKIEDKNKYYSISIFLKMSDSNNIRCKFDKGFE